MGFAVFGAVKLVGYSLSALYFRRHQPGRRVQPVVFGITRTLVGVLVGASYGLLLGLFGVTSMAPFLIGLCPIRIAEWALVLWIFFRQVPTRRKRWCADVAVGTIWSYVLDGLAIWSAFVVPGGFWIC